MYNARPVHQMDRDRLAQAADDPSIRREYRGDRKWRTDIGPPIRKTYTAPVRDRGSTASVACISFPDRMRCRGYPSGLKTSTDKLLRFAGSTECGHKSAMLKHPGWDGFDDGFLLCGDQPPQ